MRGGKLRTNCKKRKYFVGDNNMSKTINRKDIVIGVIFGLILGVLYLYLLSQFGWFKHVPVNDIAEKMQIVVSMIFKYLVGGLIFFFGYRLGSIPDNRNIVYFTLALNLFLFSLLMFFVWVPHISFKHIGLSTSSHIEKKQQTFQPKTVISAKIEKKSEVKEDHGYKYDDQQLRTAIEGMIGVPYKWGGKSVNGVDGGGLIYTIFKNIGVATSMSVGSQNDSVKMETVEEKNIRLGDILFFDFSGKKHPTNTGIYLGQGKFIYASKKRGLVITQDINSTFYKSHVVSIKRIVE